MAALLMTCALALVTSACSESPAGTYVSQRNPDNYVELRRDGTLHGREMGIEYEGTWELDGNVLTERFPEMGITVRYTLEDGKIITDEGGEWVKQSQLPKETTSLRDKLVGRWQKISEPEVVFRFGRDGTLCRVNPETGYQEACGSYHLVDDNTIRLSLEGHTANIDVSVKGDSLGVSSANGTTEQYRRFTSGGFADVTLRGDLAGGRWVTSGLFALAVLVTAGLMVRSLRSLT
jgi:hypothetical protein